jgi:hypothetical protein
MTARRTTGAHNSPAWCRATLSASRRMNPAHIIDLRGESTSCEIINPAQKCRMCVMFAGEDHRK